MITKRELLECIAQNGHCSSCTNCPYNDGSFTYKLIDEIKKLGAKEMLKSLPREFDKTKILTCVTADQAKVGQKGVFADSLSSLEHHYKSDVYKPKKLIKVEDKSSEFRFTDENGAFYSLFYPIDEVEE